MVFVHPTIPETAHQRYKEVMRIRSWVEGVIDRNMKVNTSMNASHCPGDSSFCALVCAIVVFS
jgi:hypothetical protein